jgi:hypothetical protein
MVLFAVPYPNRRDDIYRINARHKGPSRNS